MFHATSSAAFTFYLRVRMFCLCVRICFVCVYACVVCVYACFVCVYAFNTLDSIHVKKQVWLHMYTGRASFVSSYPRKLGVVHYPRTRLGYTVMLVVCKNAVSQSWVLPGQAGKWTSSEAAVSPWPWYRCLESTSRLYTAKINIDIANIILLVGQEEPLWTKCWRLLTVK